MPGLSWMPVKNSFLTIKSLILYATDPCKLAMRMDFDNFKSFPGKALNAYISYPLANQQFKLQNSWNFDVTQVMALPMGG